MNTTPDQRLDARGLMCPEPITLAQQVLARMRSGEVLEVQTTDPAAPIDFEAWCLRRGHVLASCRAVPGGHLMTITKSAAPPAPG